MKRWLSGILSLLWIVGLFMQAVPAQASGDASSGEDHMVLRIEGEQYHSVNQTPVAKSERDATRGNSTELSSNDYLFFKSATGAAIPASGYIANYEVNIAVPGTYDLVIVASPIAMAHVSPYQMKVNDGEYLDINASSSTKMGQVSAPANLFYKYKLNPVTLQEGTNTISFRVLNGRSMDGRVYFFMDYLELTKVPWGLHKLSTNTGTGIFEEKDQKEVTIQFTDSASSGHQLTYHVVDYDGNVVLQNSVTLAVYAPSYTFALPQLERGHYTITVEADQNGKPIQDYFSVVMNTTERKALLNHPFAIDVAGGSVIPADQAENYARAVQLTGVNYVRERMHWNSISSAKGAYDFSKYAPYNQAYANYGIRVLELNHIAPTWSKSTGKNLPNSLLDAYTLAKTTAVHFGSQADWEFWNEPDIQYTADSEPADQYAAFLKATTIGARDSGMSGQVALAGIAYPPGSYMELLMQNDVTPYMDIYNFHAHRNDNLSSKLLDIPPSFATHTEFIQGYGLEEKPIYVTEAGLSLKFLDSSQTITSEQLRMQARYLATSTIESISMGVDKHFWFVFPHYLENGMSWGSFSSRGTPYAAVNAQAAMTHALGEAVYLGRLSGMPNGVTNYVFRDGMDSIVAYWSEVNTPLTVSTGISRALLTDIIGREQQLTSASGSYDLQSGPDVHYLRIAGEFPGLSTPVYTTPVQHAPVLTATDRVVLVQNYPETAAVKAKTKGYLLDKLTATDIQVDVYNFNDTAMSGVVTGSVYGGWNLSNPSQNVTVPPYSKATLIFTLTGSEAVAADVKFPLAFQGEFDGEATSKSVTLIASNENLEVTPSLLVPDYENPTRWEENISSGSTSTLTSPANGEIQFDYSFGSGDKWTYPNFTLPENVSFAGSEGVVFDVYFPAPIDGVTIRSFMYESNGSGYFTSGVAPTGGWQQIKIPWADFSAFSTPDDNFHLDPEQIRKFSIGINSRTATQVSFKVRNVGIYSQADTGLYSKIVNLVPAHNQELTAGSVPISAGLIQGEIPAATDTIRVLVDGVAVASQIFGQTISASTVLAPGVHTVTVKAFDVNGKLMLAKSTVTVVAGSQEESGAEQQDTSTSVNFTAVTENNLNGAVMRVTVDDLKVNQEHELSISLPSGKGWVELGAELFDKLEGQSLRVGNGKVSMVIPPETLNSLINGAQSYKSLVIGAAEQAEYTKEQHTGLADTESLWGGSLIPVGKPLELTLHAVDRDGRQVKLESFVAPVTITLSYDGVTDPELLGLYYWNENNGIPEYVRSTYDAEQGAVSASLEHFSTYSLLAYSKDYADVEQDHWVYKAVRGLTAAHVIQGDSREFYVPDRTVTRAEFVTLLVRRLGLINEQQTDEESAANQFTDVNTSDYYASAVAAALRAGIVSGRGEDTFAPEVSITREEMAVMLIRGLRYTGRQAIQAGAGSQQPVIADQNAISEWALQELKEAAAAGLLSGYEDGSIRPKGMATRAEAAQVLWRIKK
jgi:hypothetical protein